MTLVVQRMHHIVRPPRRAGTTGTLLPPDNPR